MGSGDRNPDVKVVFGQRLRETRLKRGLAQERLAELAGLDRTYISKIEKGERNISLVTAARLARALGVDMKELLAGQPDEEPME